jgi:hypothetical protein
MYGWDRRAVELWLLNACVVDDGPTIRLKDGRYGPVSGF